MYKNMKKCCSFEFFCIYRSVRKFYTAVVDKFLLKFPIHDPVLHHLGFLDPEMRDSMDADAGRFQFCYPQMCSIYIAHV